MEGVICKTPISYDLAPEYKQEQSACIKCLNIRQIHFNRCQNSEDKSNAIVK